MSVQLNYVFNINYQPFGKLEWERLFPRAGAEFHELVGAIASDVGVPPPTDLGGVRALYTRYILDDDMSTFKGSFMKQSSWYSIIQHIHRYDNK